MYDKAGFWKKIQPLLGKWPNKFFSPIFVTFMIFSSKSTHPTVQLCWNKTCH
jgi:hypothetical protein